jgi:hypothetical protein
MPVRAPKIIDISLAPDASTSKMRIFAGFKKDMQLGIEVLYPAPRMLQSVRSA